MQIRQEQKKDIDVISEINRRAFGQDEEAQLVTALRQNCRELLSLVAVERNEVVGHVLFSPVDIVINDETVHGMGLGPMAVLPEHQRRGIGTELVLAGIEEIRKRGYPFIVVLGHPQFYPRFGFVPAVRLSIRCRWDVPDDAFMILVLKESEMHGVKGIAEYKPEFREAE